MATRLYPNTKNLTILATLAGVSVETAIRYTKLQEEQDEKLKAITEAFYAVQTHENAQEEHGRLFREGEQVRAGFYDVTSADEELNKYSCFIVFGWGRVRASGLGYAGSARNNRRELVRILSAQPSIDGNVLDQLRSVGLKMHKLGGVHWY